MSLRLVLAALVLLVPVRAASGDRPVTRTATAAAIDLRALGLAGWSLGSGRRDGVTTAIALGPRTRDGRSRIEVGPLPEGAVEALAGEDAGPRLARALAGAAPELQVIKVYPRDARGVHQVAAVMGSGAALRRVELFVLPGDPGLLLTVVAPKRGIEALLGRIRAQMPRLSPSTRR